MKGYKAFNKGWKCRDFQYELGKTYELKEGETLKICECGFHFCKNPIDVFGYYPMNDDTVIAEVEALGEVKQDGTKYVTDKIRIIKEFPMENIKALIGFNRRYNTGFSNSGDYNSGDYNSGNCNSGDFNSGDYNSGDFNSGSHNIGGRNVGNHNLGSGNSGDFNSGSCNSGDYNSGGCNTGFFNSGNHNCGLFNTDEPKIRLFNKECNLTYTEFYKSLGYSLYMLFDHIADKELTDEDKQHIRELPNFDADIFKEITGIDLEEE